MSVVCVFPAHINVGATSKQDCNCFRLSHLINPCLPCHKVLYLASNFHATDPRDVIYGLRGMIHCTSKAAAHLLDPNYGNSTTDTYRDSVEGDVHMALTLGAIQPEQPTLVRVHNMDPLRDLLMVRQPGRWSLRAAMAQVAEAGAGVVLLLGHQPGGEQILANLREEPKTPSTYSTVGAGSQILRDLGVRKMRLMSSPMKFNAISGFDLEVVEYLPAE